MKLIPVNGVNVCELMFVPEMDIFNGSFYFQTIYQVGGLK